MFQQKIPTIAAATVAVFVAANAATAEDRHLTTVQSPHSVDDTVERLTDAAESAGAMVFGVIDHAAGAESIGESLAPMKVVIFGNPEMGTPLLQESATIGIDLPLRVLVWEDDAGDVHLGHYDPRDLAEMHGIDPGHPAIEGMSEALSNLTGAASDDGGDGD
jgi:uncharacterized protein (DUF302 family)